MLTPERFRKLRNLQKVYKTARKYFQVSLIVWLQRETEKTLFLKCSLQGNAVLVLYLHRIQELKGSVIKAFMHIGTKYSQDLMKLSWRNIKRV